MIAEKIRVVFRRDNKYPGAEHRKDQELYRIRAENGFGYHFRAGD